MKKETYERITAPFRTNSKRAQTINVINKAITYAIYVAYPLLLIWLFFTEVDQGLIVDFMNNGLFIRALAVPLVSFVLLSVLRKALNAKRPYEVFGLDPIIPKKTKGKSFPSRHVFSIFVIEITFFWHHFFDHGSVPRNYSRGVGCAFPTRRYCGNDIRNSFGSYWFLSFVMEKCFSLQQQRRTAP